MGKEEAWPLALGDTRSASATRWLRAAKIERLTSTECTDVNRKSGSVHQTTPTSSPEALNIAMLVNRHERRWGGMLQSISPLFILTVTGGMLRSYHTTWIRGRIRPGSPTRYRLGTGAGSSTEKRDGKSRRAVRRNEYPVCITLASTVIA